MSNANTSYTPIDCSFYDYLEENVTMGRISVIEYLEEGSARILETRILDLKSENHVEYMVLENGLKIRLDHILTFNGKPVPKSC